MLGLGCLLYLGIGGLKKMVGRKGGVGGVK